MSHLVIAGGSVVDGSGAQPVPLDIEISEGRVAALTPATDQHGKSQVLDASGMTIAPGFIDVHSHADNSPFLAEDDLTKLLQGVTTEVVGNCGMTLAPRAGPIGSSAGWAPPLFPPVDWQGSNFSDFLTAADRCGYVTNYVPLIGHGTVRASVVGLEQRAATAREVRRMRTVIAEALEDGAFGMSTGLVYPPGSSADTAELIRLCEGLPEHAIYATHLRNESHRLIDSVIEALAIAEQAGIRLQISHHKVMGHRNWGMTTRTLKLIDEARSHGVIVNQDVYPYTASSTTMLALLPPEFHGGGSESIMRRLRDPADVIRLGALLETEGDWDNKVAASGWEAIRVASTRSHTYEGMRLPEIGVRLNADPFHAMVHLLVSEQLAVTMTVDAMSEDDVVAVLMDPHTMIGSDGLPRGLGGKPHPRISGTFPRVLSHYVRETSLLALEEAIRRMTSLPAATFGISGRGVLKAGAIADIVVFDQAGIRDRATYDEPMRAPSGIKWVILGGEIAAESGVYLGHRLGRRLRPAM